MIADPVCQNKQWDSITTVKQIMTEMPALIEYVNGCLEEIATTYSSQMMCIRDNCELENKNKKEWIDVKSEST